MRGRFITFEGGDGAGKTTQIELLAEGLARVGQTPLVTREPGGTKLAEEIRNWVLHHASSIDAEAEVLLMFAARSHHTREVIEPALESGRWVLCDRYTDASYAYQGGGRGLPYSLIASLETGLSLKSKTVNSTLSAFHGHVYNKVNSYLNDFSKSND